MALAQIFSLRDPVLDHNGAPLDGGTIDVFFPGTTNRITTYSDPALTSANENPVVLSGTARASVWLSSDADIRVNDADGNLVVEERNVNADPLTGEFNSGLIPNGSFEVDSTGDGVPDGWDNDVNDPGSNNGLDTTESTDGGTSWRTTSTGNGGGELASEAFFPVNDQDQLRVTFDLRSTVASGIQNIVRVEWYDSSQVTLSNSDIYSTTTNPTTFTTQALFATPPANARFAKIRIIGGGGGGQIAGTTYWDNFRVFYPLAVSGIFDNITLTGNDIITTNTNGALNINPDGTGAINLLGSVNITGNVLQQSGTFQALGSAFFRSPTTVDLLDGNAPAVIGGAGSQPHIEIDADNVQAKSNATTAQPLLLNTFGGNVTLGLDTNTGEVRSRNAQTFIDGGVARPLVVINRNDGGNAAGGSMDNSMSFRRSGGSLLALMGFSSSANFAIDHFNNGGTFSLTGSDTGGTSRTLFQADPDGAAGIYQAGTVHLDTQPVTGDNTTGARVLHRDGSSFDVGVGVYPQEDISAAHTIGVEDCQKTIIWRDGDLTFTTDADIPIGGFGYLIADFDGGGTQQLIESSAVITFQDGTSDNQGSNRTVSDGGWVMWHKRALGQYHIWGVGIT